jgi:hypothetical protein
MTTKDQDMSEQSNERELFEEFAKHHAMDLQMTDCNSPIYMHRDTNGCFITWQAARAPLLSRIAELEAKLEAAEKDVREQTRFYQKDMLAHCKQAISLIGRHYQAKDFAEIKQLMERTFERIDANWYDTEKLLKDIYALPKYSFLLSPEGGVKRCRDSAGNWLERYEVVKLVDSAREQAAIRGNE